MDRQLSLMLFVAVCTVHGMYEHQAGVIDWYQSNVGVVHTAVYDDQQRSVYVATDAAVLASINTKTGTLNWKQVLPEGEQLNVLKTHNSVLLTLSEGGKSIRCWNSVEGALQWDLGTHAADKENILDNNLRNLVKTTSPKEAVYTDAVFVEKSEHLLIAVLSYDTVFLIDHKTGNKKWSWKPSTPQLCFGVSWSVASPKQVFISCTNKDDQSLVVHKLAIKKGKEAVAFTHSQKVSLETASRNVVVLSTGVAVLDKSKKELVVVHFSQGSANAKTSQFSNLIPNADEHNSLSDVNSVLVQTASVNSVILSSAKYSYVLQSGVTDNDQCTDKKNGCAEVTVSASVGVLASDDRVSCVASVNAGVLSLTQLSSSRQEKLKFTGRGDVVRLFVDSFTKSNGETGVRYFVVAADQSFSFIQNGKVAWTREEALASAKQVEFVGLQTDYAKNHGFPNIVQRFFTKLDYLKKQVESILDGSVLQAFVPAVVDLDADPTHVLVNGELQTITMESDTFGFRKMIVLVTDASKLYGVDSLTGKIVWMNFLETDITIEQLSVHTAGGLFLLTSAKTKEQHRGWYSQTVDTMTGKISGKEKLPYTASDVFTLPLKDTLANTLLMVVDTKKEVHIFPPTNDAKEIFRSKLHSVFFYQTNVAEGVITGYTVREKQSVFVGQQLWTVAMPANVEKISAVSAAKGDRVETAVRILSAKEYVNKYLNPNLLVVATVRAQPPPGAQIIPSVKRPTDPCVTVYFIDGVTGVIMDRIVHRFGAGPVHLTQSENVVVYHYWNSQASQYEISVVELHEEYDDYKLADKNNQGKFSSHSGVVPKLVQQTYVLRTGVRALTVSSTTRGITDKQFLLATTSNQVVGVNRRFLDVRRPLGEPSTEEKEQGVVPYMMEIPIDTLSTITYNRTVNNIRNIVSSPALLESTVLVLSYGLDLHHTRITPSLAYDSLNEDFNFVFLIATVVAVLAAIAVTKKMAAAATLARQWE